MNNLDFIDKNVYKYIRCIQINFHKYELFKLNIFLWWCGRVIKRSLSTLKMSGSNLSEGQNFQNHFEYFSATLSQVCIQHDELGWLVTGLTAKFWPLGELCQVSCRQSKIRIEKKCYSSFKFESNFWTKVRQSLFTHLFNACHLFI